MTLEIKFLARCKAFSGTGVREHGIWIDAAGAVRVYDDVAKHYTLVHSLSPRAIARLRAKALVKAEKYRNVWHAGQSDRRSYPSEES